MRILLIVLSAATFIIMYFYLPPLKEAPYHTFTRLEVTTTLDGVLDSDFEGYDIIKPPHKTKVKETKKKKKKQHKVDKVISRKTKDYLGSIEIPAIGTKEAIYAGEGDYYLNNNYMKVHDELGEVYLDDRTGDSLTGNGSLLNGHAVPNGTKFGAFKNLLKVNDQPIVHIWDQELNESVDYKMLFVSLIDGGTSGIVMDFDNDADRYSYYSALYASAIKKWEEPRENSNFMLLNSCSYIIKNGHYVVVAERID